MLLTIGKAARSKAVKAVVFGLPPGGGAGSIPAAGIPVVAPQADRLPWSWLPGRVYGISVRPPEKASPFYKIFSVQHVKGFVIANKKRWFFPPWFSPPRPAGATRTRVATRKRVGPTRGDSTSDPGGQYYGTARGQQSYEAGSPTRCGTEYPYAKSSTMTTMRKRCASYESTQVTSRTRFVLCTRVPRSAPRILVDNNIQQAYRGRQQGHRSRLIIRRARSTAPSDELLESLLEL